MRKEIMEDLKKLTCRGRNWRWEMLKLVGGKKRRYMKGDFCQGEKRFWFSQLRPSGIFSVQSWTTHMLHVCDDILSVKTETLYSVYRQNLHLLVWDAWKWAAQMSRNQTNCIPFNTSKEIFHFGRIFLHFSTNSSSSYSSSCYNQLSWRSLALFLSQQILLLHLPLLLARQ